MPLSLVPTPDEKLLERSTRTSASTILELQSGIAWRKYLRPAKFRDIRFHVETSVRDSGRRVVNHEFPKRDVPYAEDMGRRAREFTVRGYLIVYPTTSATSQANPSSSPLRSANYLTQRDKLIKALESTDGPADLQLPTLGVLSVMCTRYRVTEEEKIGGYCVFDMTFTEYGRAPATGVRESAAGIYYAAQNLDSITQDFVSTAIKNISTGAVTQSVSR